jgi:hypothetical protein
MMPIELKSEEQEQWTIGSPNLLSEMLMNTVLLLREVTTEKNKKNGQEVYSVSNVNMTSAYAQVLTNITELIAPTGASKLQSVALKEKGRPLDYSALLGAYFRSKVTQPDAQPLVILSDDQKSSVYKFVAPLVPENCTPEKFLDSFNRTPKENHKAVLDMLIFKGITSDQKAQMFKEKYRNGAERLLDSILTIVEFMRTPFGVLDAESENAVKNAKAMGLAAAKTSGIDLQFSSMINAMKESIEVILRVKSGKISPEVMDLKEKMLNALNKCNGSFGIANERYKFAKIILNLRNEAESTLNERNKLTESTQKFLQELGTLGNTLEAASAEITPYLSQLRKIVLENSNHTLSKDDIDAMPLTTLISTYGTQLGDTARQWQAAFEQVTTEKTSLSNKLTMVEEQLNKLQIQEQKLQAEMQKQASHLIDVTSEVTSLSEKNTVLYPTRFKSLVLRTENYH